MSLLRIIFHPVSPLRRFVSLAFRPVLPVECPFLSPSFLPPSVFTVHASLVRLSWNTTVSFPPREKRRRDFPPSDFWRSLRLPFATLAITVVVSLSLCFSRATTLPGSREPRPFQPPASIHRPKLESNFPHHIPQKLLRGARLGGKQRDARLSPCARRNDETFLPPLCLFLPLPPFLLSALSLFLSCRPE